VKAVRVGPPGDVRLVDVAYPEATEADVVVQVERAAMCSTDVKLVARGADPPRIPGHEVAGWLGDGTFVGVHPDTACGVCRACRGGFETRCSERLSIGLDRDGGFAEQVLVPRRHAVPLSVDASQAPILEPLACCVHAIARVGVRAGDHALIVGAGSMGLLCMWVLQADGVEVAVCQRSRARRELAAALGAQVTLGPEDPVERALDARPRVAFVTAPGAEALRLALEAVEPGGVVHAFAGSPGGASVDANIIHYRHLSLVGSTGSTLADYERAADLARSERVPLNRLPTAVVGLEELPDILNRTRPSPELKVLIDPSRR
jgi:L-iditol 2-dehydrogenase